MGGTSAATPFVAGVAALLFAANPDLGGSGVAGILAQTATPSDDPDVTRVIDASAAVARALDLRGSTLTIDSPATGDVYAAGREIVRLEAAWWPRDGSDVRWTSNLDGGLGSGESVTTTELSPGTHTITATVVRGSDVLLSQTVTITIITDPPQIDIIAPAQGGGYHDGIPIQFEADTWDWSRPDREVRDQDVSWASSRDGVLADGKSFMHTLSKGSHTICVTATNSAGTDQDCVDIVVGPAPSSAPPTADLLKPSPGGSHSWETDSEYLVDHAHGSEASCADIQVVGSGHDPDTGTLHGNALQWSGSRDGGLYNSLGTGESIILHLCAPTCSGADWTLRLVATDPAGDKSAPQYATVRIGSLC